MRQIIAVALLLILASASHGVELSKADVDAIMKGMDARIASDKKKRGHCRLSPETLVGLSREALKAKCGNWSNSTLTVTAYGRSEMLTYDLRPGFVAIYVFMNNGVVTAVQSR